jgi:hypothetical protein
MSDDNDVDVDELFEEADSQSRTDVTVDSGEENQEVDLVAEITEQYRLLRQEGKSNALTARDERVAAILHGLDEAGELADVSEAAWSQLESEPSGQIDSRSTAISGLLRAGLEATRPDLFDTDDEAFEQYHEEYEKRKR